MKYEKQNFENGQVLMAHNMNYIEDGIVEIVEGINSINESLNNKATQEYVDNAIIGALEGSY